MKTWNKISNCLFLIIISCFHSASNILNLFMCNVVNNKYCEMKIKYFWISYFILIDLNVSVLYNLHYLIINAQKIFKSLIQSLH